MKAGYVYIMTNHYLNVLYTGVTSNLEARVLEHKNGKGSTFTRKFKCCHLVYFEEVENIQTAIEREKQIKAGRRIKKIELIETANVGWIDLANDWYD